MFASDAAEHRGLPAVWARMQIDDLSARMLQGGGDHGDRIKQFALDYNLVSAYTAFVAVDGRTRTAGAYGTTVPVPVPVPQGTRYETTVPE